MDRRYRGENVVLSVAGNVDPATVLRAASEHLGKLKHTATDEQASRPAGISGVENIEKDVEQVHFCIGTDGPSVYDAELYPVAVLDAALGGSMSSRIFQEIREKRGLAYSIGSYTLNYGAGGAFTVYGGTSEEHWPMVQELVRIEFDRVMADGLDAEELARTKRHISGNLVLALEGMSARMMRMSRNELHHSREIPIEETLDKINAVTNDSIVEIARNLLDPAKVSTTAIGPVPGSSEASSTDEPL
jgi:predicted Zn-dependent peptidase